MRAFGIGADILFGRLGQRHEHQVKAIDYLGLPESLGHALLEIHGPHPLSMQA
jgi:hypothetical protein